MGSEQSRVDSASALNEGQIEGNRQVAQAEQVVRPISEGSERSTESGRRKNSRGLQTFEQRWNELGAIAKRSATSADLERIERAFRETRD